MTLNGVMAVALRYFTDFGKRALFAYYGALLMRRI